MQCFITSKIIDNEWPSEVHFGPENPKFNLVSPHYPSHYPRTHMSKIDFIAYIGSNIIIEWDDFQLESETNCSFDRVIISEQVKLK